MSKRKHRFVVGYPGDRQVTYGKDVHKLPSWIEPMTMFDAKRRLKKLYPYSRNDAIIFEIVPTKIRFTAKDREKIRKS